MRTNAFHGLVVTMKISNAKMRCFSLSTAILKMHVFKIEKVEVDGEVRAPFGAGLNNYDVMKKVAVTAKPNERVSQWSPALYLVKKLPETDTLPGGTEQRHLYYVKTCKRKDVTQTPAELKEKLDGLKKTVGKARQMTQFTVADGEYWDKFFADRENGPTSQDERVQKAPDPVVLARVKTLLWGEPQPVVAEDGDVPARVVIQATEARREVVEACASLRMVITPRETPAGAEEWGRSRATGYVVVAGGQTTQEAAAILTRETSVKQAVNLNKYFEELEKLRGHDIDFLSKIQVKSVHDFFDVLSVLTLFYISFKSSIVTMSWIHYFLYRLGLSWSLMGKTMTLFQKALRFHLVYIQGPVKNTVHQKSCQMLMRTTWR